MEKWKDVEGFEGLYQISNLGRLKSLESVIVHKCGKVQRKKETIRKLLTNNKGYLYVVLYKNSVHKKRYIHRLVAQAFIPNPNNLPHVNHIDFNPQNNSVENLEWVSPKENYEHSLNRQNDAKCRKVKRIDPNTLEETFYNSMKEAKEMNGFSNDLGIRDVCQGKRYLHKGFHWEYIQ